MKEKLKNQIISELTNAIIGSVERLQINIVITKINNKEENVLITYEKTLDKQPTKILERKTKNGYMWAAGLIMTLAKIKWFNTNIIIVNDEMPY